MHGPGPFDDLVQLIQQVTGADAVLLVIGGSARYPAQAVHCVSALSAVQLRSLADAARSAADSIENDIKWPS